MRHLEQLFRATLTVSSAVETPNKIRVRFVFREFMWKIRDRSDRNQPKFRNVDSHFLGQCHHREFVFRYVGKSWRRQLYDPLAVPSLRRNAKLFSAPAYRREFELNASERET
jgi:hypothetical protein